MRRTHNENLAPRGVCTVGDRVDQHDGWVYARFDVGSPQSDHPRPAREACPLPCDYNKTRQEGRVRQTQNAERIRTQCYKALSTPKEDLKLLCRARNQRAIVAAIEGDGSYHRPLWTKVSLDDGVVVVVGREGERVVRAGRVLPRGLEGARGATSMV